MKNWQIKHIKKTLKIKKVKGKKDVNEVSFTHSYRFSDDILLVPELIVTEIRRRAGEEIKRVTETVQAILKCQSEAEFQQLLDKRS